ncbi:MAG: hypothetical protein WAS23_04670 [Dokdonella sp.]|uniref:hypothetical protein n=1 Tax=Dokdonella sp. TaxID=2291710 RepID=UPI002C3B00FA|nr:hypothetical protein [Dokdonella sp.]HPG93838.1 hypothetical protein [Dokdonella sp.]HPN80313.1 hypothetical protein [Dokdonella sp.]
MAEFWIRDIDNATLDRLNALANERGWSPGATAVRALRYALGLSTEPVMRQDRQDIATMRGVWNQSESQAFHEAMEAFRQVDSGPSFEPDSAKK